MPVIISDAKIDGYRDILDEFGVPEQHEEEFILFAETGQASEEFTEFLEGSDPAQQALEKAFLRRVEHVRQVLDVLQTPVAAEPAMA